MPSHPPLIAVLALILSLSAAGGNETSSPPAPSTTKPAETSPKTRPPLPAHDRMLILQFESRDGNLTLTTRTESEGRVKPAPAPEGRTGVYFRALNPSGALVCDGMLPDPFIVRVPPPPAGTGAPAARTAPPADRNETSFLVRLPAVAELHSLELFRVPAGTAPGAPRDAAAFRMGTFTLTKK